MRTWQDDVIVIDSSGDYDEIARKSAAIAGGFLALERSRASEASSLSKWIAATLAAPEAAQAQVAEYAMTSLQRLLQVAESGSADRMRLAVTTVGYWIHNQLLPFPGVLLNAVAAASYLDIDPVQFAGDVTSQFDGAKYHGPFSELAEYWWIAELDAICAAQMVDTDRTMLTGRQAAERLLSRAIRCARCAAGHDGAGYYCLITKKPVCAEHSVRPGTWLPLGADRSRIEKTKYEELSAWLPE